MTVIRSSTGKMFQALGGKEPSELNTPILADATESVHLDSPKLTPSSSSMAKKVKASLTPNSNFESTPMS